MQIETIYPNISDWQLLARMKPFIKPLWPILTLGAVLIFCTTLASVSLPYITQQAIDHYIRPVGPKVTLPLDNEEKAPSLLVEILKSEGVVDSGYPGIFFLKPRAASLLDYREEKMLIKMGFLSQTQYYVNQITEEDTPQLMDLAKNHPTVVQIYPELLAVEEDDLTSIPKSLNLILRQADLEGLGRLALIFSLLMFASYIFEFGQRISLEVASQRMSLNLHQAVLSHIFSLSQSFFADQQSGRLASRITNNINIFSNTIQNCVGPLAHNFVSIVLITVIMLILSPKLALLTMIFTPLVVILTIYFARLTRVTQRKRKEQLTEINRNFIDTINGIDIIKSFQQENRQIDNFTALNNQNHLIDMKLVKINAIFMPLLGIFAPCVLALIIWFGGKAVLNDTDTTTLGMMAAFVGYSRRYFLSIQDLAEKINLFQSALAALESLTELLDTDEKIMESSQPLSPISTGNGLEFRNVYFRYGPNEPWAIQDLNFKIALGESVALVGQTGSGKSSIINLIQRTYDPQSGAIFFNGQALKDLELKAHQVRLGLVAQDAYLYSGTVMDNLRLSRQDLSQKDIIAAVEAVGANHFIENLPHGYQEPLGPGGLHLSAGERQLLAYARVFIRAPEVIISDEAIAAVDSGTEAIIEKALQTLVTGRTAIIIAHRLGTIRWVDRILVFHQGRLIEEGTHQQLLDRRGTYYNMAILQGLA